MKKALTGSVLIILISFLLLGLLYAIVNNTTEKHLWIVFVIWGGILILSLLSYWIYQIKRYLENEKK